METLSNILASFDIFQVLINAFPLITDPIIQAFEQIFTVMFSHFKNLFLAHPGLSLGLVVFATGYAGSYAVKGLQRMFTPTFKPVRQRTR
jgi:hypothetical protein